MAHDPKIEAVQSVEKKPEVHSPEAEETQRVAPNKEKFDSFLQTDPLAKTQIAQESVQANARPDEHPFFIEERSTSQQTGHANDQQGQRKKQEDGLEVEGVEQAGAKAGVAEAVESATFSGPVTSPGQVDPAKMKAQAQEMADSLKSAEEKLSSLSTDLQPSYKSILKHRLTHINEAVQIALSKTGMEGKVASAVPAGGPDRSNHPLKQFLGYLTHGQRQLETLGLAIDRVGGMREIPLQHMLALQFKMNNVQQEIELFTSLLNKALESLKTVMNVQV